MTHKKIVFVIVEGPSDDEALGLFLDRIYDESQVYVHIVHGDITTERGHHAGNIMEKIRMTVEGFARSRHLKKVHFQEVVHIVDTDGAFIPDDCVVWDPKVLKTFYSESEIRTKNAAGIRDRNAQKSACLRRMVKAENVWDIPYRVYYMSSNLDHVLYNKLNSSDDAKEQDSIAFARKYLSDLPGFIKYICASDFSVTGDYKASWEFIEKDLHSLKRHTNLGIRILKAKE